MLPIWVLGSYSLGYGPEGGGGGALTGMVNKPPQRKPMVFLVCPSLYTTTSTITTMKKCRWWSMLQSLNCSHGRSGLVMHSSRPVLPETLRLAPLGVHNDIAFDRRIYRSMSSLPTWNCYCVAVQLYCVCIHTYMPDGVREKERQTERTRKEGILTTGAE